MTVQSHLSRHQPKAATTPAQLDAMAARAWLDHQILVVRPERLDNESDRLAARGIGDRLYGKRAHD